MKSFKDFLLTEAATPKKTIKAYKLFRTLKTKPGQLFPLFIGKSRNTPKGKWLTAKFIPTEGFKDRPGWHVGLKPIAPHLMKKDGTMQPGRVWAEVEIPNDVDWQSIVAKMPGKELDKEVPIGGYYNFKRPKYQGSIWMIAGALKITKVLTSKEVTSMGGQAYPEDKTTPKQENEKESFKEYLSEELLAENIKIVAALKKMIDIVKKSSEKTALRKIHARADELDANKVIMFTDGEKKTLRRIASTYKDPRMAEFEQLKKLFNHT